jgi:hypothetical protein
MSRDGGTLYDLTEHLRLRSPEHLDLFASLNEEEFQIAFDSLLGKALAGMEESKVNFQRLDEPGLSAVLRLALNVPGLSVSLEQYSNGHADLTFESYRMGIARRILGEAKIYDGPQYHIDGINQLLGYMTGREIRGLMVVYMRKADGVKLMKKVQDVMDANKPSSQQGITAAHALKWCFDSLHTHPCGEDIRVSHVMCNLYVALA